MVETAEFKPPVYYELDIKPGREANAALLTNLLRGYMGHVNLLKKTGAVESWEKEDRVRWQRAFCWLYDSTSNNKLAMSFFDLTDAAVKDRWEHCTEYGSP